MAEQIFVARERELGQLQRFLDRALASQGTVCFVTGEAGAGKTALVTEFARRAQTQHDELLVAIGDCNAQTGIGDPYLPFREVLGQLTGDVEAKLAQGAITPENAGRLQDFLRVSGQALVEYGPDLIDIFVPGGALATRVAGRLAERAGWVDHLEELARHKAETPTSQATGLDQAHIFEQYTSVLKALAARRPLLLAVDDLQWADVASISLLFHLGRRVEDGRVMIVGAYRPADVALRRGAERHPLEPVLNELKRYYGDVWIDLGQAGEMEGRRFVDAWLETEPNRLGEEFRQALYRHTEGHPLFTIELLRNLQERGDLMRDEEGYWVEGPTLDWDALPARIEGVIDERIGRLETNLTEALTTASVEGKEFTAEVVARVQAVDERELVRRLSNELERQHRLVRARGIQRIGAQRLSLYRFQHHLFQQYLYDSLDQAERAYLHEDVGNVLEALYGDHVDEIAVQLARHFEAAGVWEKVLAYAQQAGQKAQASYASPTAIEQYTRALEAARKLSTTPPPKLYRARGVAYEIVGEFDLARDDYEAALRIAQTAGDHQAEWRALLKLGSLWAARDYSQTGEYFEQALELARTLDDPATLVHSLNRMGNWCINVEQPLDALRCHQEALTIVRELNDQRILAETLDLAAMTSFLSSDWVTAAAYRKQAISLFRELDDRQGLSSALAILTELGIAYDTEIIVSPQVTLTEAIGYAEEAIRLAREIGWRAGEAFGLIQLSLCLSSHGDYGRGLACVQEALDIAQEIKHRQWLSYGHAAAGRLYLDLLAAEEACRHDEQALALAHEVSSGNFIRLATGCLARAYTFQNDLARAESMLTATLGSDAEILTYSLRHCWCAHAELALAQGDAAQVLHIIDQMMASTPNLDGTAETALPRLGQLRGEALILLNELSKAESALQAAREGALAQGARPLLWRIHVALGKLRRHQERIQEAESEFAAARTIIQELAASVTNDTLRDNFARAALAMIPRQE